MVTLRDKVRGMLIGGAIGDALGMPVETWSPSKILQVHPNGITKYESPKNHKWFDPETMKSGMVTDDTQLTLATARGIINAVNKINRSEGFFSHEEREEIFSSIAQEHVSAMKGSVAGWGNTTKESIRRLANGVYWKESGKTTEENRGGGNGVPMKCSPLSALKLKLMLSSKYINFEEHLVDFSKMTHWTAESADATIVHNNVMIQLLISENFDERNFVKSLCADSWSRKCDSLTTGPLEISQWTTRDLEGDQYKYKNTMRLISDLYELGKLHTIYVETIRDLFGNGNHLVWNSVPFSYMFFIRNPNSVDSILDVINAGGDTDTNAKLVGEMLGALHGMKIFEENEWILKGLTIKDEVLTLADEFCDVVGF